MIPKRIAGSLVIVLLALSVSCATGISKQTRSQVTYTGSFSTIQKDPGGHVGSVVMLGGKILETKASSTSSEIALLQLPLGKNDRPKDGSRSEGRFLLRAAQFLDPAIYRKGTLLTVVGRVSGSEVRPIEGSDYAYPVVESIEIKHWPERNQDGAGINLGVGVGSSGRGGAGIGFGF
jgi:outer membrane lipoprotein